MARERSGGRIIPSQTNRERSIVIVVLIVVVAIIIIVVAIGLYYASHPANQNVPAGPTNQTPTTQTVNQTSVPVKVDSFTYAFNSTSGDTDFLVTVTNTVNTEQTRNVTVAIYATAGVPAPNEPYPTRQNPTNVPAPFGSSVVTLAPGETQVVTVSLAVPPNFSFDAANVAIAVT
jgi:hypothetical protein